MSPTLKLIRECAEQRLTVGGVWMEAESLPGGFSTTARQKTHSTSKHSRSSVVTTRYLHCCCRLSRRHATSALSTAERFHLSPSRFLSGTTTRPEQDQLSTTTNRQSHSGGCWVKIWTTNGQISVQFGTESQKGY